MVLKLVFSVVSASCFAAFRGVLPAPALPTVNIGGAQATAAGLRGGTGVLPAALAPLPTASLPSATVLPAPAALLARPAGFGGNRAVLAAPAAAAAVAAPAEALPDAARAAAPALAGKAPWAGLFDGTRGAAANGVLDARATPLIDSWEQTHRLYNDVRTLHDELSAVHAADRAGTKGLEGRKRALRAGLAAVDERVNGPLEREFAKASARLKEARASRDAARADLTAAMRSQAGRAAISEASREVRRNEAGAAAAGLRVARLLLEGEARVHSKEGRRNAAIKTLASAADAALALHTEVAYGGARTLRASGPIEVPVRRWQNAPAAAGGGTVKVSVPAVAVYPDLSAAVRAQEHQVRSMESEAEMLERRASEVSFWVELLQGAEGAQPLAPAEDAAFASFVEDSVAWAGRGAVPAKREAARLIAEAASAAAEGSFGAAAERLDAARNALDSRASEVERIRRAVERRAARLPDAPRVQGASARHETLMEAAARWRRFLRRPLDAKRAADLAGEARNHREAYLSQDEPGLPGYRRAAKDLERLEAALTSLSAADARAVVERFEEDLIHRRSLRISIVLHQDKAGGTTRKADRFALPGTTLKTLLKRVGGIPEKPEVRVNGGEWTPYARLNLRGKLADETLVEVLLPAVPAR
jgi:hypothetical protein